MIEIVAEHEEGFMLVKLYESNHWIGLKLIKHYGPKIRKRKAKKGKRRRGKANWWLAWNTQERRLRRDHDAGWLAENRPDVYLWVQQCMMPAVPPN